MNLLTKHTVTANTVGLWQFDDNLLDSSGNNLTLGVAAGTERYADIWPGVRGFLFDRATTLSRPSFDAALAITGDLTIMFFLIHLEGYPYAAFNDFVGFAPVSPGGTSATNTLYLLYCSNSAHISAFQQHNGNNVASAAASTAHAWPPFSLCHVAVTRISNVIRFYTNGRLTVTTAALTTPTGGGSSRFWVGARSGTTTAFPRAMVSSVKVMNVGLSTPQVVDEYNATFGPLFGLAA